MRPQVSLSREEWFSYDISGADVVVIATIVGMKDTIVDLASDGSGIPTRSLTLGVTRWLRGSARANVLHVGLSPVDEDPLRGRDVARIAGTGISVLAMLSGSESRGWVLCDSPNPDGGGMRLISQTSEWLTEEATRIVARQDPDTVLARVDVALIGHKVDTRPCASDATLRCAVVRVDSLLFGNLQGREIAVYSPMLPDVPDTPSLFLLRKAASSHYESIEFQTGMQRIVNGRLDRWGLSISELGVRLGSTRDKESY
jgi:hypothetical protein